jgi:hypothetical protein
MHSATNCPPAQISLVRFQAVNEMVERENLVKETRIQVSAPGGQQKTVISRIAWHVDEERTIRIRRDTDEILPSLNRLAGIHDSKFLALPFRRNLSARFIHQIT